MKHNQPSRIFLLIFLCLGLTRFSYSQVYKQDKSLNDNPTVKSEINLSLTKWNDAAKSRNVRQFMDLFDSSDFIMLVGSDSAEVFRGRKEIETWITELFSFASFSWDMKSIDIDHNGNTAWIFMDGFMVVTNDKGKTTQLPYRFTGILIKDKGTWKWRLFNGSVPRSH